MKVEEVQTLLTNYAIEYGMNIIGATIILIVGFWLAKLISGWTAKLMISKVELDPLIEKVITRIVYVVICLLTIVAVLGQFGVETTSFVALLGASGLAVGLALQGTLSNVAAGIMLLVLRPFSVGHAIHVGGKVIIVDELGLFCTRAHEPDGPSVMMPNSKLWGSEIINYSVTDKDMRRLNETIGISYDDDIDQAFATIREVLDADQRILDEPAKRVAVISHGDSSVNILVHAWCMRADWWDTKLDFMKNVKIALDKAGITIPFPQTDVHLHRSE